jgi:hypothetical protein
MLFMPLDYLFWILQLSLVAYQCQSQSEVFAMSDSISVAPISPSEAAAAIVALIHSSPRSPLQEEIEAILARLGKQAASPAPNASPSNVEFAPIAFDKESAVPALAFAIRICGMTQAELTDAVRNLLDQGDLIVRLLNTLQATSKMLDQAWARVVLVGEPLEDERIAGSKGSVPVNSLRPDGGCSTGP